MGEVSNSYSGGTPSVGKKDYYGGDIPFIRSAEINSDSTELTISEAGLSNSSAKIVEVGDILYAMYGATSGEVGISRINGAINQAILAIRPKEYYDSQFIMQWLRDEKQKILDKYLQGGQGNLSGSIVKDLKILFPNYDEQREIGIFFERLDHLITLHQRKYDALSQLKKAYLQNLFPSNGESVPKLRFTDFNGNWEKRKLNTVIDVNSGRDYKHLSEGDIPVYGTGGYMLSVNEALSYNEDAVGIGRKGTIDKPFLLQAPFWTVDTLFYVIPKKKYDLNFLYSIFQRINWKQKDESTGVPSLSKATINGVSVKVPKNEEQIRIGHFLKELDALIIQHQQKIEQLKQLKQAYLQKMFV